MIAAAVVHLAIHCGVKNVTVRMVRSLQPNVECRWCRCLPAQVDNWSTLPQVH